MTQHGSPYDNAVAERLNGIFKIKLGLYKISDSFQAASKKIGEAVRTPMYRHAVVIKKPRINS
jgi:putative transposase